jgi:hypothetical protein
MIRPCALRGPCGRKLSQLADGGQGEMRGGQANEVSAIALNSSRRMNDPLNVWDATPVIENSEPNFRKGSEAEIQTRHYRKAPARAIAAAMSVRRAEMQCERSTNSYRAGIAMNWSRAQGSAAEMLESVSTDSRHYPQERGAHFAEGGGRFTGMPRTTLRIRHPP